MREINLTKNKVTIVDEKNYNWLNQFKWHISTNGYASRTEKINGKKRGVLMHRLIMGAKKGEEVDHINGNRLDNRKSNLRLCNREDNSKNVKKRANITTSRFKGVSLNKQNNLWECRVSSDKKYYCIGYFTNEIAAANAYNYHAQLHHGEFAKINNVEHMEKDEFLSYRVNLDKTSKYRGVSRCGDSWLASIKNPITEKYEEIGYFKNEEVAANAYNYFANKYYKDHAKINECTYMEDWKKYIRQQYSKYKGVSYDKKMGKWVSKLIHKGEVVLFKYFEDEDSAANCYNHYSLKYRGENAKINDVKKMDNWMINEYIPFKKKR